jgi:hypothetical protein
MKSLTVCHSLWSCKQSKEKKGIIRSFNVSNSKSSSVVNPDAMVGQGDDDRRIRGKAVTMSTWNAPRVSSPPMRC